MWLQSTLKRVAVSQQSYLPTIRGLPPSSGNAIALLRGKVDKLSEGEYIFVTSDIGYWFLTLAKKEFRLKNSSARVSLSCKAKEHSEDSSGLSGPFRKKVTEAEDMSQLGCVDSGNK